MQKFSFVSTPIFYVNAAPHIGHLYSAVLADALHRWNVLKGVDTAIFSTGTDEHGLKVQKSAEKANMSPLNYCDAVSEKFKRLFNSANIGYTDYVRTTEARHRVAVSHFWNSLAKGDHIYKGKYEGWYSITDEAFVTEQEAENLRSSGQTVDWTSEENYIFRLSSFKADLLHWLNSSPSPVYPEGSKNIVEKWIHESLSDLSVSRPSSRLSWGIPVPTDPSHTIYVWLDALVNYLTVGGYPGAGWVWPAPTHIVGKDILRFHAVYWPAFLMAAGLEPPGRVISHAHWTMGRVKMSKSRGNVVDPHSVLSKYGVDAVRYFLLKDGRLHQDGDFSESRITTLLNGDLADTLGNLLLRVTSSRLYPNGGLTHLATSDDIKSIESQHGGLLADMLTFEERVSESYNNCEFGRGISDVMNCLRQVNAFIDAYKPWLLVKDPTKHSTLSTVLQLSLECLRLAAVYLWPVIPSSAEGIIRNLNLPLPLSPSDLHCHFKPDFSQLCRVGAVTMPSSKVDVLFKKTSV